MYAVKTDGRGLTAITHFNQIDHVADIHAVYAPDGASITFSSSFRGGVRAAVYLMGAHGTDVRIVTPTALEALDPGLVAGRWQNRLLVELLQPTEPRDLDRAPGRKRPPAADVPRNRARFHAGLLAAGRQDRLRAPCSGRLLRSAQTMNADGTGLTAVQADAFRPNWGPTTS